MNTIKKCKYADKYKATREPKCNGGNPCLACKAKWKVMSKKRK